MSRYSELKSFYEEHGFTAEPSMVWTEFRREELGLPWQDERGGQCPDCRKGSVKVSNGKWFCFYCESGGTLEDAVELTDEQRAAERILQKEKQAENREKALRIWNEYCVPITGSNIQVHTYFRARCLSLDVLPDLDGVMRWNPKCPFGPGNKVPCVVSLFRDARSDEPTAIHRTDIIDASRGKKAEPMALGSFAGSVIKLWPLTKGGESLTLGEGIETVLAAVKLGVGEAPAWAATVAGNLSRVPVILGVERLIILADNDPSGTGQQQANGLRRKWRDRGREVAAKMPTQVGWDFNDVLMRGQS